MPLVVDIERNLPGFNLEVSFTCRGDTLGLLGSSGSGKSMTLRCIAGLDRPSRGCIILGQQILFDSEAGINLPPQQRKVGFLFQNYALFPHLTVVGNIAMGLRGIGKDKQQQIIKKMISMVKLDGLENRFPHQLSGGQQQRTALARALAIQPRVLLLDEPFSALDNHLRSEMEQELAALVNNFGGLSIFVTHNLEESYRLCANLLVLEDGKMIAHGPRNKIFDRPPTLETARMTGCQNLSRIKILSDNKIEALDWGCSLQVSVKNKPAEPNHVGIYSHHIRLAGKNDTANVLNCRIINVMESLHHVILAVKLENSNAKNINNIKLYLSKEEWQQTAFYNSEVLKIHLPSEKIFLTK